MNSIARMYPNLSAAELSSIIMKGKFDSLVQSLDTGKSYYRPYGAQHLSRSFSMEIRKQFRRFWASSFSVESRKSLVAL